MFPQQMFRVHANEETFRETSFCKNVSATMFPRLRGPSDPTYISVRLRAAPLSFRLGLVE